MFTKPKVYYTMYSTLFRFVATRYYYYYTYIEKCIECWWSRLNFYGFQILWKYMEKKSFWLGTRKRRYMYMCWAVKTTLDYKITHKNNVMFIKSGRPYNICVQYTTLLYKRIVVHACIVHINVALQSLCIVLCTMCFCGFKICEQTQGLW